MGTRSQGGLVRKTLTDILLIIYLWVALWYTFPLKHYVPLNPQKDKTVAALRQCSNVGHTMTPVFKRIFKTVISEKSRHLSLIPLFSLLFSTAALRGASQYPAFLSATHYQRAL